MSEARCMKCRTQREIQDEQEIITKNGKSAVTGKCGVCGTKLFRFIKKNK